MTKFSDRLKRLHSSRIRAENAAEEAAAERDAVYLADAIDEVDAKVAPGAIDAWRAIGADIRDRYGVLSRSHGAEYLHGRYSVGEMASVDVTALAREVLGLFATPATIEDVLFIDLETAGLGDGPGNEAWCVGVGTFDDGAFIVDHLILPEPTAERELLREVARRIADARLVVSFNGATFDLPRLASHFARHEIVDPIPKVDHIDLLKVTRRLVPAEMATDLQTFERRMLGFERHGDVPGSESPRRWARYLKTLNVRPLLPLVDHNRLDIVTLAAMFAYLEDAMSDEPRPPRVERDRPNEPPAPRWSGPEVTPDEPSSEFRQKLVRSYRLKSRSSQGRVRRQPDRVAPAQPRPTPGGEGDRSNQPVGDRLTRLRRDAARLLEAGDDDAALPLLHEMVALSPRNPFPLAELARYYRNAGDSELAQLFEARLADVAPY